MNNYNKKIPNLIITEEKKSEYSTKFTFEYLSHQIAVVTGNSLRQILLNYISSWAIFAVHIKNQEKDAKTEYEKLAGIKETIPYLILNLKNLLFFPEKNKADREEIQILKIKIDNSKSNEEYQVTGKDIQEKSSKLKVINSEIYLTTVSPNSKLEIDLYCRYHWGYHSDRRQKSSLLEKVNKENLIFLDTDYSPVEKVAINNEEVFTTSLDSEEEKLSLTITTNGTINPQEVLQEALKIWKEFVDNLFSSFSSSKSKINN